MPSKRLAGPCASAGPVHFPAEGHFVPVQRGVFGFAFCPHNNAVSDSSIVWPSHHASGPHEAFSPVTELSVRPGPPRTTISSKSKPNRGWNILNIGCGCLSGKATGSVWKENDGNSTAWPSPGRAGADCWRCCWQRCLLSIADSGAGLLIRRECAG